MLMVLLVWMLFLLLIMTMALLFWLVFNFFGVDNDDGVVGLAVGTNGSGVGGGFQKQRKPRRR